MNLWRWLGDDRGQATVLFAVLSTALIGSAALVVDVGRAYVLRASAENAMAAATLAGAAQLPADPTAAVATAQAIGTANGFPQASYQVACGGTCIEGTVATRQTSLLAQILGVPSLAVGAAAAAARAQTAVSAYQTPAPGTATTANGYTFFSSVPSGFAQSGAWGTAASGPTPTGGGGFQAFSYNPNDIGQAGLLPFDVTVATATATPLYTPITLKVGAGEAQDGNFGAVRIDGPGASVYEHDIVYGAATPVAVGDVLTTQPGDMVGPTVQGMEQRVADYANGDPQLAVVPVVEDGGGGEDHGGTGCGQAGASSVTVVGFAAVRITGYAPGQGNEAGEVTAEFVGAFLPSTSASTPTVATGVWGGMPYQLPPDAVTGPVVASSTADG